MATEVLERRMAERCATCAFRAGTEASKDEMTQMIAKLCIILGDEFICHESPLEAWCAGAADALASRIHSGAFTALPEWKRKIYRLAMDAVDRAKETGNGYIAAAELDAKVREFLAEEK